MSVLRPGKSNTRTDQKRIRRQGPLRVQAPPTVDALQSRAAHAASEAAHRQGKFWEMHDRIFAKPKDLSPATYLRYANEMGLDIDQYNKRYFVFICSEGDRRRPGAGRNTRRVGKPSFFINGRFLSVRSHTHPLRAWSTKNWQRTRSVTPEWGHATTQKLWPKANAQLGAWSQNRVTRRRKRIQRIRQLAFRPRLSGELANRICDGDNHRARLHDGSCKSSYCAARASFDPGRSIT